jgi:hypothetical protein
MIASRLSTGSIIAQLRTGLKVCLVGRLRYDADGDPLVRNLFARFAQLTGCTGTASAKLGSLTQPDWCAAPGAGGAPSFTSLGYMVNTAAAAAVTWAVAGGFAFRP